MLEMNLHTLHLCYSKWVPGPAACLFKMLNLKLDLAPLNQNLNFNEIPSDVYTKWVWETFSNTVSEMFGKSQSVLEGPSCRAERPKWAQVRAVVLSGSSPTRSCRTNTMDSLPSVLRGGAVVSSSQETPSPGSSDQRGSCHSQAVSLPYFLTRLCFW